MGHETTVSLSPPCFSFQKKNELFFFPLSAFPIHCPASSNNRCFKHALQQSGLRAMKFSFPFEFSLVSALGWLQEDP